LIKDIDENKFLLEFALEFSGISFIYLDMIRVAIDNQQDCCECAHQEGEQ
jgi:hypothetical protein